MFFNMQKINKSKGKSKKIIKCKFTPQEDATLRMLVLSSQEIDWTFIASHFYRRSPRQCRERWQNYLNPSLINTEWTPDEDEQILEKFKELGPHWNAIAKSFAGRSGNSIRNRYLVLKRQQKKRELELKYRPQMPELESPPPVEINETRLEPNDSFNSIVPGMKVANTINNTSNQNPLDLIFNNQTIDNIFQESCEFDFLNSFIW